MTTNNPDVVKKYADDLDLTEEILDASFTSIYTYQSNNEQNWKQALLDIFKVGYNLDNDGVANKDKSLEDKMEFPTHHIYHEDFMEAANSLASTTIANAYWTGSGTNGTQAIVAQVNGILRLSTTATANSTSAVKFTETNFDTLNAPHMEFRLRTDNITNTTINAGFRVDANDYVYFVFDTDVSATNIYIATNNNGAGEITTDTGVPLSQGSYLTFRIKINSNSSFTVYINDVEVALDHTGGIRSLGTFVPYFYVDNKAAAENKDMDIDYVRVIQNR